MQGNDAIRREKFRGFDCGADWSPNDCVPKGSVCRFDKSQCRKRTEYSGQQITLTA
jgi:hypothetical protein